MSTHSTNINPPDHGSNVPQYIGVAQNFVPANDANLLDISLNTPQHGDVTQNTAPANGSNDSTDNLGSNFSCCSENSRN